MHQDRMIKLSLNACAIKIQVNSSIILALQDSLQTEALSRQ